MSFPNKSKEPLYRTLGRSKPLKGDFGIELELEGSFGPARSPWALKEEGSLRGGGEFVLKNPVTQENLTGVLAILEESLKEGDPIVSIRCSTHIHLNMQSRTNEEIHRTILVYYLLEPLFLRSQPAKRQGNLFCLGMEHSETLYMDIMRDIEDEKNLVSFSRERNKYSALNLWSLKHFGSLEFRFLDAITDMKILEDWCRLFYRMAAVAAETPTEKILPLYEELSPTDFIKHFLGEYSYLILKKNRSNQEINSLIHTNYDYVFEIIQALTARKFSLPKRMWEADLIQLPGELEEELAEMSGEGSLVGASPTVTLFDEHHAGNPNSLTQEELVQLLHPTPDAPAFVPAPPPGWWAAASPWNITPPTDPSTEEENSSENYF